MVQPRWIEKVAKKTFLVSTVAFQPQSTLPDMKGAVKVKHSKFTIELYANLASLQSPPILCIFLVIILYATCM